MSGVDMRDDTRLGGSDMRSARTSGVCSPSGCVRGVDASSRRSTAVTVTERPEGVCWCWCGRVEDGRSGEEGRGVRAAAGRRGTCLNVEVRRAGRGDAVGVDGVEEGPAADSFAFEVVAAVVDGEFTDGSGLAISNGEDTVMVGDDGNGGRGGDADAEEGSDALRAGEEPLDAGDDGAGDTVIVVGTILTVGTGVSDARLVRLLSYCETTSAMETDFLRSLKTAAPFTPSSLLAPFLEKPLCPSFSESTEWSLALPLPLT